MIVPGESFIWYGDEELILKFRLASSKFISNILILCLLRWSTFRVWCCLFIISLLLITFILSLRSCLLTCSIIFKYLSKSVCNIEQDKIIFPFCNFSWTKPLKFRKTSANYIQTMDYGIIGTYMKNDIVRLLTHKRDGVTLHIFHCTYRKTSVF